MYLQTTTRNDRGRLRLAMALLLALGLQGCGGDQQESADAKAPAPGQQPGTSAQSAESGTAAAMGGGTGSQQEPNEDQRYFREAIAEAFASEPLEGATMEGLACSRSQCRVTYSARPRLPVRALLSAELSRSQNLAVTVHDESETTLMVDIPGESIRY